VRRLAFFGAIVLFPCILLIIFGALLIRQDRELARRHADDQRRARTAQEHQVRLARLERMKLEAAETYFSGRNPNVDFATLIIDNGASAPWSASVRPSSLEVCESAEFAAGGLSRAIDCYSRAIGDGGPTSANWTRLMLGRALLRAGDNRNRQRIDYDLLATRFDQVDDEGVPFAFYAADRLLGDRSETPAVMQRLHEGKAAAAARSPSAAYLLKSIAQRAGDATLERSASVALEKALAIATLRADIPALLPSLRRNIPEPTWLEHGPWMLGLAKAPESGKELLIGILHSAVAGQRPASTTSEAPARTLIYIASLGLVFLIAASGAYLLWRDVRRDIEVAALRSQFVSSVSHELKTPIAAIRMFAETLRMRPFSDGVPRDEYLATIIHESERLTRLVDNVLDFSKIEQGRKLYELRPTSIGAVIEAVVRTVQYPVESAGFILRVSVAENLPQINGDADALQQALLNLVANAIKYSGERKEIELAARIDGGVVISVRDYGIGIPIEHRNKIFERFYRVPTPDSQRVPGAGLGLTLVAHIANAHGGCVSIESTSGAGSIFALRLPVERVA
jgi:signal transduction histidine kinase